MHFNLLESLVILCTPCIDAGDDDRCDLDMCISGFLEHPNASSSNSKPPHVWEWFQS